MFALLADRVRSPSVSWRSAALSRPALVWLRSTPAATAAYDEVVARAPVSRWTTAAKAMKPRTVSVPLVSAQTLAASLTAPAVAPAAVQGVAFAPARIALGNGGASRWVRPPADAASAFPAPPPAQLLAMAAREARQRQALAELKREAEAAVAGCQAGCTAAPKLASSSDIQ